ncbi:hypothetical protein [Streptomyces sp. NBC_01483]|uniref:hypothetical protein n=1 Tax=Streptomyces sp. NBC_01483 TaxID=2903883 RepID=UPI002E2F1DD9|nr:hypothetical protein [Streptomyces sp. NBC_01483]
MGNDLLEFNGMLAGLRAWSRAAGLLRGQRTRGIEAVQSTLRNYIAHPIGYNGGTPVDAALALRDLAEFINQLWGHHPTPGGRLYPAPVEREIAVLSWNDEGSVYLASAEALRDEVDVDGCSYILIRSVSRAGARPDDAYWSEFDARFETTQYPADYLWGPGTRGEALAWLDAEQPQGDIVDYIDRIFLLREHDGQIYPPMRPEVVAGLNQSEWQGTWHTVKADFPEHAFSHVRGRASSPADHARQGDCKACPAHHLASGDHERALRAAENILGPIHAQQPPRVCVPHALHWPHRF